MNWNEEHLRKKFEGYEETPSPKVWENIENSLHRKTRGVIRWPYYLLSSFLLIAGLTGGYYLFNNSQFSKDWKATTEKQENRDNPVVTSSSDERIKSRGKSESIKKENTPNPTNKGKDKNQGDKDDVEDLQKHDKENSPIADGGRDDKGPEETDKDADKNLGSGFKEGSKANNKPAESDNSGDQKSLLLSEVPLLLDGGLGKNGLKPSKAKLADLPNLIDSQFQKEEALNNAIKWKLAVESGPFKRDYLYSFKEDNGQDRLKTIKNSESKTWGYRIGVNSQWNFPNDFRAQLGIRYEKINQQFNHNLKPENPVPWDGEEAFQVDGQGSDYEPSQNITLFSLRNGPSEMAAVESVDIRNNNEFQFLTVPASVGYCFWESKFNLYLNAGIEFKFLTGVDALVLGENENLIYKVTNPQSGPFRAFNVEYELSLMGEVPINKHMGLMLKPYGQIGHGSIYLDKFSLDKRPYQYGFNLGLNYKF